MINERVKKFRAKNLELGRKRKEYYVTDMEHLAILAEIKLMRTNDSYIHLRDAAPDMHEALRSICNGEGLQPGTTIEGILAKATGEL